MKEREGDYWQPPLQPEVHPLDSCGCVKPKGFYGRNGWHWKASETPGGEVAVERCPAYLAAVKRSGGWKKRSPARRRR